MDTTHTHTPDYVNIEFGWGDCRTSCQECGKRIIWKGTPNEIIRNIPSNSEWKTKKEHFFARQAKRTRI
jgi:DNA-directed RNA polymerase subunit RPC12/RpoP